MPSEVEDSPPSIESFRSEKWLTNQPLIEELLASVRKILQVDDQVRLSDLHTTQDLVPQKDWRNFRAGRTLYAKRYHSAINKKSEEIHDFSLLYQKLVRDSCASEVGLTKGCGEVLLYQKWPTFRVVYPGRGRPEGKIHKDADYFHQIGEINFWIPFVDLRDHSSACLYAESEPGRGDFHTFNCALGEFVRFWGNQVTHYTVENDSDITRVSMDFRVIRLCDFKEESGKGNRFKRHEYYNEIVV